MLRKVISLPEGVYYRGRFRAAMAWSKVSQRRGEVAPGVADAGVPHGVASSVRRIVEEAVSGDTETSALQVKPLEP